MIYVIINDEETALQNKNIYMVVSRMNYDGSCTIGMCDTLREATHFNNTVDAEQAYYALLINGYKRCHVAVDSGVCVR
jgi:hypothetical protein